MMSGVSMKGISENWKDRTKTGCFHEAWVGACLSRSGLYTLHHPFELDDKDHSQSFDLTVFPEIFQNSSASRELSPKKVVLRATGGGDKRGGQETVPSPGHDGIELEVKSRTLTFSGPDDYPFDPILVCAQDSWMKKWPGRDYTMRDFLFVSTRTGGIVWLPAMTQVTLGYDQLDRARNYMYKAVVAKTEHLRSFGEFVDYVKSQASS